MTAINWTAERRLHRNLLAKRKRGKANDPAETMPPQNFLTATPDTHTNQRNAS